MIEKAIYGGERGMGGHRPGSEWVRQGMARRMPQSSLHVHKILFHRV